MLTEPGDSASIRTPSPRQAEKYRVANSSFLRRPAGAISRAMLDDFGSELEEIKREIVESRSLSIKTNNLVNALSADVNSIAKRQQNYESKLRWNSAVAYVVTVVVLLVVAKVVVDARVEAVRAATQDQRDELGDATKELERLTNQADERRKSERAALEYYRFVEADNHEEVLRRYPEVSVLSLSGAEKKVFATAEAEARTELSLRSYLEGLDHVRTGRWQEAERALSQSLDLQGDAAHSPTARYELARSLQSLGRQRDAIPMLIKLSEASSDKEIMDEATLLLAECQLDIRAYNDAKATLRAFLRRFPGSPATNDVRAKLADIQMHH
jgi:TolA-binding protein